MSAFLLHILCSSPEYLVYSLLKLVSELLVFITELLWTVTVKSAPVKSTNASTLAQEWRLNLADDTEGFTAALHLLGPGTKQDPEDPLAALWLLSANAMKPTKPIILLCIKLPVVELNLFISQVLYPPAALSLI